MGIASGSCPGAALRPGARDCGFRTDDHIERMPPARAPLPEEELAHILTRNIHALANVQHQHEAERKIQQRIADRITGFAGSITSVVLHLTLFGGWLLINSGLVPGIRPVDPFPFVMLAMFASVEAIFLSTFVLISQNRMAQLADERAELSLQISLLAEHEVTRLIQLVDGIARRLDVRVDVSELDELKKDVRPEVVVEQIERVRRDVADADQSTAARPTSA